MENKKNRVFDSPGVILAISTVVLSPMGAMDNGGYGVATVRTEKGPNKGISSLQVGANSTSVIGKEGG
jgi:hypothetical protein